jgi:hypothetical protein
MNNDDLKLLRGISQRIRDPSFDLENTISYPLCVFLSLTSPMEPNLFKSINYSKTINSSNRSEIYATRRSAFINEAKFAQSKHIKKFWQQHKITWLHGSSSSNLPSILNYGGILPAGLLLQEGGSPNGGKLLGNHNHFNATQNSGEIFSQNFVPSRDGLNAISHLKSAASRFLVCQLYGTSILRGGESKQIDSYTSYTQIINTLTHHSKEDSISNTDAISTYASILYLRKSTPTEPAILRNILQMFINPHNPSHHLLSAALTQSVTPYSTKDLKFINEQFPIIWASSTLHPKAAIPPNDITEYTTQGKARLGIDLPIAFAPQKYIETLQETLKPHAVQVFPLTHGGYLELKNIMAHGGIEIKPSKKMP